MRVVSINEDLKRPVIVVATDKKILGFKYGEKLTTYFATREYPRGYWNWAKTPDMTSISGGIEWQLNDWYKLYFLDKILI